MSKQLYLMRHAKSSWKQPDLADQERPLAGRGRRAARLIARHLRDREIVPELVLCSTARRTRETFELIEPALEGATVRHESALYGASSAALLERLHEVRDGTGSVLLIGHNPAIEQLAIELARPSPARRELEVKFPTAALATLEIPGLSWRGLGPHCAALVSFVRPRDLNT